MGKDQNNVPGEEGKPTGDEGTPPGDGKPAGEETPPKPPTDEELRRMFEAGELLTKDRNEEIVRTRLEREREAADTKAAQEKADAEAEGKRKALADQEKYKELAESLTSDVAAKDTRIKELQAHEKRVKDLEERLGKVVASQLEGLAKPYQDLVAKLSVEERADWLETNAELLKSGDGKPAGSPASPPPVQRNGTRDDEAAKQARADMRRSTGSRI